MDEELAEMIYQAAQEAFESAWEGSVVPDGHFGAVTYAMPGAEDRAGEADKETREMFDWAEAERERELAADLSHLDYGDDDEDAREFSGVDCHSDLGY